MLATARRAPVAGVYVGYGQARARAAAARRPACQGCERPAQAQTLCGMTTATCALILFFSLGKLTSACLQEEQMHH